MSKIVDSQLNAERHDVFDVLQLTRGTKLENNVATDLVDMDANQTSKIHRHNFAETVLFFLDGTAVVEIEGTDLHVQAGDRLTIGKAAFHGVRTGTEPCRFISVQTPPILNKRTGFRDLEERDQPEL